MANERCGLTLSVCSLGFGSLLGNGSVRPQQAIYFRRQKKVKWKERRPKEQTKKSTTSSCWLQPLKAFDIIAVPFLRLRTFLMWSLLSFALILWSDVKSILILKQFYSFNTILFGILIVLLIIVQSSLQQ